MPNMTPADIKQMLKSAGYEVVTYRNQDLMSTINLCVGFVTEESPFEIAAALIEWADDATALPDLLREIKQSDNPNLRLVYYLPRTAWTE